MNINGNEISQEELIRGAQLADTLLAASKRIYPEGDDAIFAGLGAFLGLLCEISGYENTRNAAQMIIDTIVKYDGEAQRVMNGPELKVIQKDDADQ